MVNVVSKVRKIKQLDVDSRNIKVKLIIGPVSKQRLFIPDLLFIDHFTVSGDERCWPVASFLRELLPKIQH